MNAINQYFIRVCLVTTINEQNNCRYIHPYELEDINNEQYNSRSIPPDELEDINNVEQNNRKNNVVYYPIEANDYMGIKRYLRVVRSNCFLFFSFSFPNLRIVKRTASELKNHGDLHVFDSPSEFSFFTQ